MTATWPAKPAARRGSITLRQLRCFVAVVETGRFSRAATRLRVAQPGLSLQIGNLERQLGVALLLRDQTGARSTELGLRFYRNARSILDRLDSLVDELQGAAAAVDTLTLGFAPECGATFSQGVTAALISGFPSLRVRVIEAPAQELQGRLDAGSLDLAIMYEQACRPDLSSDGPARWPLFSQRLFYVAGDEAARAIPLSSLMDRPLALPPWSSPIRTVLDEALGAHGIQPRIVAEADTPGMLLWLAQSSAVGTVLPWMGSPDPAASWSLITKPELVITAVLKARHAMANGTLPETIRRIVSQLAKHSGMPPADCRMLRHADGHTETVEPSSENNIGRKER